mgnify:CR=1 FL=1
MTLNCAAAARILCLPLGLGLAMVTTAPAQEITASITGTVTDPSGTVIADARVTATDVNRRTVSVTQTNSAGIYVFPRIPASDYEIAVEVQGFRKAVRSGISLELNQRARVDIRLEIGQVTETVEVTGEAPLLSTDTTVVGSVIDSKTNVDLPLNGRNFITLTLLTPGTTTPNPSAFSNGVRTSGSGRPYVNGNREQANNFMLDGVDNNQRSDNLTAYQPNVDAIAEFKMITQNAPAEFGNYMGAVVNVTLKSGTNEFHGSLFEFIRNDKLNANNWARNFQGQGRQALRQNVFGGTFGGPVMRNRVFFFVDYQGLRRNLPPTSQAITVLPAEFRQGDFSRLLSERGTQLFDPATLQADGRRSPFPNNQIPLSRFNPVSRNLLSDPNLYPLPISPDLRFNAVNGVSSKVITDQGDAKGDVALTEKDRLMVRFSNGRQDRPGINSFPLIFDSFNRAPFKAGVANWTRTLSPTVVNEARVGVNRVVLENGGTDKGLGNAAEQLGISRGNERGPGLMSIQFDGGLSTNLGSANIGRQTLFANNTYQINDNLTVVLGRHIVKSGFMYMRSQQNTFFAGNNGRTGFLRFNGQFTSGPNANSPTQGTGFAEADFVLGNPARLGRGVDTGTWGHRQNIWATYVQDDWRVTDTLTLNLGYRWEYHSPFTEVNDRQSNFSPFTGELLLAGQDGNSRHLIRKWFGGHNPRVGFAWTPGMLGGKTVIRGAYSISNFQEGTGTNLRMPLNPPFNFEFERIFEGSPTPGSTLDQGLNVIVAQDPFTGANIRLWDKDFQPGISQQWSLFIERQLPSQVVFTAGYLGQQNDHLVVPAPFFQRQLQPDGTTLPSPFLSGNPLLANIAQISGTDSNGNASYHGLQVSARKRFSQGLSFQLSYTFSKVMTDATGFFGTGGGQSGAQSAWMQDFWNRRNEYGPAGFDQKHNFIYSYVYELPFGRNKAVGANWGSLFNHIAGNWQLSGILTLRTGFPLTITGVDRSGTISRGPQADRLRENSNGTRDVGPGTTFFDTTAFAQPVAGTLGNSGVGVIRGPNQRGFDLSVQKTVPISEFKRLEFRGEFFNLTNTPFFNSPNRAVQSATFGEVTSSQNEREIQFALKFYF